jgi:predicted amidohydrolase
MTSLTVGAVQPYMRAGVQANEAAVIRWLEAAGRQDVDLLVFPEMMLTGYDQHLHEVFAEPSWYGVVDDALERLCRHVDDCSRSAILLGTPYRTPEGYLNAMVLLEPGCSPVVAGARGRLEAGWRSVFGFMSPPSRDPYSVLGVRVGCVVCAEATHLDELEDSGLAASELVVWPGAIRTHTGPSGEITRDNCRDGARSIARILGAPVVQANYASQMSQLPQGAVLGGSVMSSSRGSIRRQGAFGKEELLVLDLDCME